ncbi:unnamed protein product [Cyclocybe aegerita]|uniref:RNase H type-1 domain-containing protein n=1 Tax=Cyclocybe aegerita TaxID=1973307 RepID=A0A8S0W9B0_CYCAE|nr:unnamed protein product [Cyclocybe aegerita]
MVFTDSMGSAHRAVDPSMHSGQAFSLSVCCALQEWFEADDLHCITFVYVPSALRWDIHDEAHKYVTELKVRVGCHKTDNSIDVLRSRATHSVLDTWSSTFQDPTYRGSEFLELQWPDGRPMQPSITEFARVCQCITGHAPIGAYYHHFKINEPHGCTCGTALQSHQHILFRCHDRYSVHYPCFLRDIASFMKYNPTVFGFNRDPLGVFALVLEHDKTELFHFSRRRDAYNPSLDLGYAPHTGATPLKPKTYWRYLGFYFDHGLTFQEHVRYYATKVFTTVQAMRMLRNSTRGLSPKQRRLLYRSCVVPIATYGYRLWYFDGARNKGAMNQLKWMQRKAALWITGAFRTSPTGGLEALAGLIPVHLMLKKLATCAVYRVATLSDTHPLRSMMGEGLLKRAAPHARSAALITPAMQGKVKSTVMEVDERVHTLTESFEPFAPKARPSDRLLDRYADRLHFDECDPTQDRCPYLDELIARARADPLTVLAATDGSVPQSNQYQAASAAIIYKGHRELERTRYVSGRVTAPDAELNAISCAVRLAVKQANCQHIMVFTDSIGSARRAVDPGMHSGQAFSLSVCHVLQEWFEADDLRRITFVYVPSALRWDIHGEAHKYVTELKVRVGRRKTDNSIDALRSRVAHSVLDSWNSTFQDPTYRGSEFLELQQPDGRPLQPSYLNGGPWLSTFGHSITEFARVCRCITGHAPIGAYYRRFKINEPHGCTCGAALQSRQHVLFRCRDRYSVHYPRFLGDIAAFMKYNHAHHDPLMVIAMSPVLARSQIGCVVLVAIDTAALTQTDGTGELFHLTGDGGVAPLPAALAEWDPGVSCGGPDCTGLPSEEDRLAKV